jgi:solute carrier family 25 phosphate transporter 23/24/25/41
LYVDDKESAAGALVSLAEDARLATKDVKAPTSNAILTVCKSLLAGGVAGGV